MEKNQFIEVNIDSIGTNGEGVARFDGMVVFVKNALPPERVEAKIISVKKKYAYAIVNKTLGDFSPIRNTPPCPYFGKCGGCSVQHILYEEQLKMKRDNVADCLHKAGVNAEVNAVIPSDKTLGYRNKMSLPVRQDKGETKIGLFALNSHRVVEIDECLLQPEWNKKIIALTKAFMRKKGWTGYDETRLKGDVRHIVAREVEGKLFVTLVSPKKLDLSDFATEIESVFPNTRVFLNINKADNNVILGDKWIEFTVSHHKKPTLIDGIKVEIHPAGFFQVNDYIRSKIYSDVRSVVANCGAKQVVDAYSGAGIMTAMLAPFAEKITGIEINREASESAQKLIDDNEIGNMTAILGDVKDKLTEEIFGKGEDCAVVLDPPRAGCDESVLAKIKQFAPKTIVYVSCDPATLARDIARLAPDYTPTRIRPYDMFPQTKHVETLAILIRNQK